MYVTLRPGFDPLLPSDDVASDLHAMLNTLPPAVRRGDLLIMADAMETAAMRGRASFQPPDYWIAFASALRAVAGNWSNGLQPGT